MDIEDTSEIASRTPAPEAPGCARPRILIADDHEWLLRQVTSLLEPYFELVGTVKDGKALVAEAQRLGPDLIVLDISMPIMSGIEAAREIHLALPAIKLVFLTAHADPDFVSACFAEGALGYVLKLRLGTDLIPAINDALQGKSFVSSAY
jgi:DNA-binding NarL/FixJ family response regulator